MCGGAYRVSGTDEKCIQNFSQENCKLGRRRRKWSNNIKTDIKELIREDIECFHEGM